MDQSYPSQTSHRLKMSGGSSSTHTIVQPLKALLECQSCKKIVVFDYWYYLLNCFNQIVSSIHTTPPGPQTYSGFVAPCVCLLFYSTWLPCSAGGAGSLVARGSSRQSVPFATCDSSKFSEDLNISTLGMVAKNFVFCRPPVKMNRTKKLKN